MNYFFYGSSICIVPYLAFSSFRDLFLDVHEELPHFMNDYMLFHFMNVS